MESKIREGFFSSEDQSWATPWWLFRRFDEVFHFKLDPCATSQTAKCEVYFTKHDDGLAQDWSKHGNAFVNPPFGRELPKWVKKSYRESQKGITVCMLIPARTDTIYWHKYCFKGQILFIKGRITFESFNLDTDNPAFFPSALVAFGKVKEDQKEKLSDLGTWK